MRHFGARSTSGARSPSRASLGRYGARSPPRRHTELRRDTYEQDVTDDRDRDHTRAGLGRSDTTSPSYLLEREFELDQTQQRSVVQHQSQTRSYCTTN